VKTKRIKKWRTSDAALVFKLARDEDGDPEFSVCEDGDSIVLALDVAQCEEVIEILNEARLAMIKMAKDVKVSDAEPVTDDDAPPTEEEAEEEEEEDEEEEDEEEEEDDE
jgi:hypothetical protein